MICSFLSILVLLVHTSSEQPFSKFKLPDEWPKDFTITASGSGGMLDHESKIVITYDSCTFFQRVQDKEKENAFLMTAQLREEVLKKLRELKVDRIKEDFSAGITYDKDSRGISFVTKDDFFSIQDSSSSNIKEQDSDNFNQAYGYLQMFAMEKHKK